MHACLSPQRIIFRIFTLLGLLIALAGCGGGGGSEGGSAGVGPASQTFLSGSVGDGPVVGATVALYSANGTLLATTLSDQSASYSFSLSLTPQDYPLLLEVSGGTDLVTGRQPDFRLVSVAMSPGDGRANINPFSTLIVGISRNMSGGLNATNLALAKSYVISELNFGLDTSFVSDPITTPITQSNVAHIVKASETLGEMIRRTRDSITATGAVLSGDQVMTAMAADMTDGMLDGSGAAGTDATIAAVANVVTGQVLVEALSNNLKVDGVPATNAMDQAIMTTTADVTSLQLTDSVLLTGSLLNQLQVALSATLAVDSSTAVTNIEAALGGLYAGMTASDAGQALSPAESDNLDGAITQVSQGSVIDVAAVNAVVSNSGSAGSGGTTVVSGSTTLSWNAPVARADGAALSPSSIGGYRVYYGTSPGNYPNQRNIADPTATSYTLGNVPAGTYYIVMTTYDTAGRESVYSAMISRAVN